MASSKPQRVVRHTVPDGQQYVIVDGCAVPVTGTLSDKTTPADFRRYAEAAQRWQRRRRNALNVRCRPSPITCNY